MIRKTLTVIAVLAVALATMPVLAAFAADASATLNSPANLYADGGSRGFQIGVTNDEEGTPGTLGIGGTPGASIKFINVTIPTNMVDVACNLSAAVADDFNCQVRVQRNGQSLLALEATGDGLAADDTLPIDFTADVVAPLGVERTDTYEVRTGITGNDFEQADGVLTQTVRGLQIGDVITLDDLRTGAEVGNRFTSNQLLHLQYDVTNKSAVAIDVTGAITGAQNTPTAIYLGGPADLDPANPTVPAGETRTLTFEVDTAGVTNGFTDYVPFATASGQSFSSGINTSQSGNAVRIAGNGTVRFDTDPVQYRAEAEAHLAFPANAYDSVTVNGNDTNLVSAGPTTITVDVNKSQLPRVDLAAFDEGLLVNDRSDDTGSYAVFTVDCATPSACPSVVGGLAAVDGGSRTLPRNGNANARTVELTYQVNFGALPPLAVGQIYDLDVDFFFEGIDDNLYDFDAELSLDALLQIDLDGPVLVITEFAGNVLDNRVKDGDTVSLEGYVQHTGDLDTMSVSVGASTPGSDGTTFNVVAVTENNLGPEQDQGNGFVRQEFTTTVNLPGEANGEGDDPENAEDTHALGKAGILSASGSARDEAGNQGTAVPATVSVDNDHPDLAPVVPVTVNSVSEQRALGFYLDGSQGVDYGYGTDAVVRVTWNAGTFLSDVVEGGCNPDNWDIDDVQVVEVRYHDNSPCEIGSTPPAYSPTTSPAGSTVNDRVLVLSDTLTIEGLLNFSYIPELDGGIPGVVFGVDFDPVRDDILNQAYQQDGIVVDANTPPLPVINSVLRDDLAFGTGYEVAGFSPDTDAQGNDFTLFHTNTDDLIIPVTGQFFAERDQLQVVSITDTANFDPNNDDPSTYSDLGTFDADSDSQFTLDATDIALSTCAGVCQVRTPVAFRFLRTVQVGPAQFEIRLGDFTQADFLYDTQVLQPLEASLAIDANGTNDVATIDFDGVSAITANAGNTVVGFYARADEWAVESVLGDGSSSTDYALHIGETVAQLGNTVEFQVQYSADSADYYGNSYFKLGSGQMEDLAGNLMADSYRILPGGVYDDTV